MGQPVEQLWKQGGVAAATPFQRSGGVPGGRGGAGRGALTFLENSEARTDATRSLRLLGKLESRCRVRTLSSVLFPLKVLVADGRFSGALLPSLSNS